jgi:hypothetical protein
VQQQRENLYQKLEALRAQGILLQAAYVHLCRKRYLDGVQTRFIELLDRRKQLVQRLLGAAHPFRISLQRFQDLLLICRSRNLRIQSVFRI